jgi:5-methylcytosine-specific restriction protein A
MPWAPRRHCASKPDTPPPRRPSPSVQGYGRAWQCLAQAFKRAHPFCADPFGVHGGRFVLGDHVDHIVARKNGGTDEWSNLRNLCRSCHSYKTAKFDGGFGNQRPPGGE